MAPNHRFTRDSRINKDGSGRFEMTAGGTIRPVIKPTRSQSMLEYILFGVFGALVLFAAAALYTTYSPSHKIVPNTVDAGLKQDRINIVFIGIGGDAHPGGGKELADSIIFASLKPSTKQAAVISIPRDLWVKVGGYGTHRINSAHAIGEDSGYPGEGPGLLCDTVSQTLGQPVHAFVRVDFRAFEKVIDELGGIDVYVQRSFYDYLFRDGFRKGWQHLDGKRALAYARYRYVIGPEGDNFARELRQQQVMNAVRDRLQRLGPNEAMHLIAAMGTLSNATETNLTTPQMVSLYRNFHDARPENIRHVTLKRFTETFMVTRLGDPGEAVRPKGGDFREFQSIAENVFQAQPTPAQQEQIQFAAAPKQRGVPAALSSVSN